jgi:two-component system, NtrC family, sensor kinase
MQELAAFKDLSSILPLYFFYGLSFLFLGSSIAIKDLKGSSLKISNSLWLLSAFGFSHGIHEWIILYLLLKGQFLGPQEIFIIKAVSLLIVLISFTFLLQFGLSLLYSIRKISFFKWVRYAVWGISLLFLLYFWFYELIYGQLVIEQLNILIRRTFGIAGSFVTAYALLVYSKRIRLLSEPIARFFLYVGVCFFFYGVFSGVVSSHVIIPVLLVPIELFRAISAILITYFLMKGLNIFDIETRNKLEQQIKQLAQAEKMASLGRLASGVAHEINTPLTNASLNMQMLRSKLKEDPLSEMDLNKLDAIEQCINRASVIAGELLQFSHMKKVSLAPANIEEVLSNALELLEYKFSNIIVKRKVLDFPEIMADAAKLEQVFINLINNSIEAMPDGGDLKISSGRSDKDVWVKISDTGIGITKNLLYNVFDPFYTTKEVGKGTGLGLSICLGIIELHQGTIKLEGEKGKGATATITLPLKFPQ